MNCFLAYESAAAAPAHPVHHRKPASHAVKISRSANRHSKNSNSDDDEQPVSLSPDIDTRSKVCSNLR